MKRWNVVALAFALLTASVAAANDNVGLYHPGTHTFLLRNTLTSGGPDEEFRVTNATQAPPLLPISGAFEGDSLSVFLLYDRVNTWFSRVYSHATSGTDGTTFFRPPGNTNSFFPIAGDWDGDGRDTVGIFDRATGIFYLTNNSTSPAQIDASLSITFVKGAGWLPVAGDWDGDGDDTVGGFHTGTKVVRLRDDLLSGHATRKFTFEGLLPGAYSPIAGDWNSDGKDSVGVYNRDLSRFFLKNASTSGTADLAFNFGTPGQGYLPLAGNWDGDAFRFTVPQGPNGEAIVTYPYVVQAPGQALPEFELYYVAGTASRRILYNVLQPTGGWKFAQSRVVLTRPMASVKPGSVLISEVAQFRSPQGQRFKRLLYFTQRPDASEDLGWLCLSFSNDGLAWTSPIFATYVAGQAPRPCIGEGDPDREILAQAASGFRSESTIWLGVMNGSDAAIRATVAAREKGTETFLYRTSLDSPWLLNVRGEFSREGIRDFPGPLESYLHRLGLNLDFSFDPSGGFVYFSRVYPYPYAPTGNVHCLQATLCELGVYQTPNRAQIYRMQVEGTVEEITQGVWSLVDDIGSATGFRQFQFGGGCSTFFSELTSYQNSVGLDVNALSFYKGPNGTIDENELGGRFLILEAGAKQRIYGECQPAAGGLYALPIDF